MKNRKYCFDRFVFYDKEKIEKRLEYMAEQGWLLEKIGVFAWVYRKIEPQKIAFSVAYFPKAEALTIEPTEEQEIFYEFCEHTRWKLLYDNAEMQILYNTSASGIDCLESGASRYVVLEKNRYSAFGGQNILWSAVFRLD